MIYLKYNSIVYTIRLSMQLLVAYMCWQYRNNICLYVFIYYIVLILNLVVQICVQLINQINYKYLNEKKLIF